MHPDTVTNATLAFYDPDFYEWNIGEGPRLGGFYAARLAGSPGSVVEFGCGTGDILIPLVSQGRRGWGLDFSSAMLERCQQKCLSMLPPGISPPELICQNALESTPTHPCDYVILANDLAGHFHSRSALLGILRKAYAWNSEGGHILLDFPGDGPDKALEYRGASGALLHDCGRFPYSEGRSIHVWHQSRFCPDTRIITARYRYEILSAGESVEKIFYRSFYHRPWSVDEVVLALIAAGYPDPEVEPFGSDCGTRILIGARRGQ